MKIKINQIFVGEDGKTPLKDNVDTPTPITLRIVCIKAVLNPLKDDDFNKKMEKYNLWKLFLKAEDVVELTAEEITILKQSIDQCWIPLILGQAVEMLEQKGGK